MLDAITDLAFGILIISVALCLYRVVVGPSLPDRIVGLDIVAANVMATMVILAIKFGPEDYLDAVLIIAVLSFVGTVSLCKYLGRGRVIDRHTD